MASITVKNNVSVFITGFVFSENEHTALEQLEGGPCAVIAPVQVCCGSNLRWYYQSLYSMSNIFFKHLTLTDNMVIGWMCLKM